MTKIEYADVTVNDQGGCTPVSQGCLNCFARPLSHRLACMGQEKYRGVVKDGKWTGKVNIWPQAQGQVLRMKGGRRIFWNSMSDAFHSGVPDSHIDRKMAVIALAPQHSHMIFTKRPERMCEYLSYKDRQGKIYDASWETGEGNAALLNPEMWPIPNLIGLVSVSNQDDLDKFAPWLLKTPLASRGVSLEPLLGPVNVGKWLLSNKSIPATLFGNPIMTSAREISEITGSAYLDQLIIGCESGPHRRKTKLEWVYDLVQQAKDAGVAIFIKQLEIDGRVEHDMSKFPPALQIREMP